MRSTANNAEKNILGPVEAAIAQLPVECQGCSVAQFAIATAWVFDNDARFRETLDGIWLECRRGDPTVSYVDNRTVEGFEDESGQRRIITRKNQPFPCRWLRIVLDGW